MTIFIPPEAAEPFSCRRKAEMLEETREIFESWGIRIGKGSRLEQAQKILRDVADNNAYPTEQVQRLTLGRAMSFTYDLVNIAQVLPDDVIPSIKEDVRRCFRGRLDDVKPTEATRAQSQLGFGTVLAAAGLRPQAPATDKGKTPDYVITSDGIPFGVEVKRPESVKGGIAGIDDAVIQFREFDSRANVIVIDVADAIDPEVLLSKDGELRLSTGFQRASDTFSEYIHRRKRDDGYSRICLLAVTARAVVWSETPARPGMAWGLYPEVFPEAVAGLLAVTSSRVRSLIESGFKELGGRLDGRYPV